MRQPIVDDLAERRARAAPRPANPSAMESDGVTPVIGGSIGMLAALKVARQVAPSNAAVVITGESGTGKELLARLIHDSSSRASGPFVAVNCAAIPETLLESELFGHERGAFTGAVGRRAGRFERASGGTLFLDEVGDMSPAMQAKILRVLQEHEIERVGAEMPLSVDVRVLAATNRDLAAEVAAGRFRDDLYYRLAVVEIYLPPLRERGDDVAQLAWHFLERFAAEHGRAAPRLSPNTLELLRAQPWPGNIRQLRNVMERALLVSESDVIGPEHLSLDRRAPGAFPVARGNGTGGDVTPGAAEEAPPAADESFPTLREVEDRHIRRALTLTGGNLGHTAELLGIHRNTLREKLRKHRLDD